MHTAIPGAPSTVIDASKDPGYIELAIRGLCIRLLQPWSTLNASQLQVGDLHASASLVEVLRQDFYPSGLALLHSFTVAHSVAGVVVASEIW